jgi:hypothetical protein
MKTLTLMLCPPPYQRTGDQGLRLNSYHPHLTVNSSPQKLEHLCQQEIKGRVLLTSFHSLRQMVIKQRGVNSACEFIIIIIIFEKD